MKKIYILLLAFIMLLLAACSSDDQAEERQDAGEKETKTSEGEQMPEPERIFIQEFSEDDRLDFTGLISSGNGDTIIFTLVEEIKRDSTRERHIIYGDNEPMNVKELSEAPEEDLKDRSCRETLISANGKYVTYKCVSDEDWFVIYDTEEESVVNQVEEPEDYSVEPIGITNDLNVLRYNADSYIVSIKNAETDEKTEYDLIDLSNEENLLIEEVLPSEDGKTFLTYSYESIYVLDTEAETVEKLTDIYTHDERLENEFDDLRIGTVKMSPNGKYVYYRIGDASNNDIDYSSSHFVNLETMETRSFLDFEYSIGTIDNDGNFVLYGHDDDVKLYNMDEDEAKLLPINTTGTYFKRPTIAADGSTFLYADRPRSTEETPTYELFRLDLTNMEMFESVPLDAEVEDTEALVGEATKEKSGEGFELYPVDESIDVVEQITTIWEQSESTVFPSSYPMDPEITYTSMSDTSYRQTIRFDSGQTDRREINYEAQTYPDLDRNNLCIDDDLELEETIDGIDYYFYIFSNDDAELAFVDGDWCYSIEGKGFTKDEMFDIAASLEMQGKQPNELPIEDVKFPTALPSKKTEISRTNNVERRDGAHDFFVTYRGDEGDTTIEFEVSQSEPQDIDHDEAEAVELENGMEGIYRADRERLFAFDGTYYYTIISKIDEDVLQEAGGRDELKDVLTQIAEALE